MTSEQSSQYPLPPLMRLKHSELQERLQRGVIFIGMSGSGKTTIGQILAHARGYTFIDSDRLIESRLGNKPLQKIVDSYPNKHDFLAIEKEVLENIKLNKSVLATGGSACYTPETLRNMGGVIVFLNISWELLIKRLGDFSERGVISLHKSIEAEYKFRMNIYRELAHLIINCDKKSKQYILNELQGYLTL